jgi:pyruvate, water dikinase
VREILRSKLERIAPSMASDHLYYLNQIQVSDRSLVGDKAFYLSVLMQQNYPVIPGFVVSVQAFREFLEAINWLEPLFADLPNSSLYLDVNNPRQLQAIAQQIRHAIQTTPLDEDWLSQVTELLQSWHSLALILRPSFNLESGIDPTLSQRTAGLFSDQVCWANRDAVAHTVKQVWGELFRARSLVYWQRSGVPLQHINLAVLVQPIWSAIASGDLYISSSRFEIQSTLGLGKALIEGEVTGDRYQIHPHTGLLQQQHLGSKTYAYRVAKEPQAESQHIPFASVQQVHTTSCLQGYLVDSVQQNQYALTQAQLQQLIQLTQQAAIDMETALAMEWTIAIQEENAQPSLQFTQVIPQFTDSTLRSISQSNDSSADLIDLLPAATRSPSSQSLASHPAPLLGLAAATGRVLARALVVQDVTQPIAAIPTGTALVAPSIVPSWITWLKHVAGIVTDHGGITSHGAILARELGIPAVVGVGNATRQLQTGDALFIDGDRGVVQQVDAHQLGAEPSLPSSSSPKSNVSRPVVHRSKPTATRLLINLSYVEAVEEAAALPVDGVGLLRSELMLQEILKQQHLTVWLTQQDELVDRIASQIERFACAFAPRPVFYRSLDLRSHEFSLLSPSNTPPEQNPILGLHGAFSYQFDPSLFDIELAALRKVQQAGYENVNLLLPFVRTVAEFSFCRQRVIQTGLTQNSSFQLWIMAEVPSVVFLLPEYVQAGVQGISIGSNDLTQLMLAVDRDQHQMAAAFDQLNPSVLRAMQQLIRTARQEGIPCSICGQAPAHYPELTELLVKWGITSISISPDAVERTYEAIARAEHNLLLEAARQLAIDNSNS